MIVSEFNAANTLCCVDLTKTCAGRKCMAWRDAFDKKESYKGIVDDPAAFKEKGWAEVPTGLPKTGFRQTAWVRTEIHGFCGRAGTPTDDAWAKAKDVAGPHNAL